MKIDPNTIQPTGAQRPDSASNVQGARGSGQPSGTRISSGEEKDHATLTERARLLSKARGAVEQAGDVETARAGLVQSLRTRIETGDYSISYDALARKLLSANVIH